jgi:cation transport regulator ChaC
MALYLSYGSNMNQDNMNRFCDSINRRHIDLDSRNPRRGSLEGYKLDFNYYSSNMGGGAGNLTLASGETVKGVVYDMTEDDFITLDKKEGLPTEYRRIEVPITLENGTVLEGVITYIACDDRTVSFSPPTKEYKKDLIDGARANGLSPAWIAMLEALPTQ